MVGVSYANVRNNEMINCNYINLGIIFDYGGIILEFFDEESEITLYNLVQFIAVENNKFTQMNINKDFLKIYLSS